MIVRIVYESSTTSNIVGLSVRHNNTRIHVRVRQELGYRQHGGLDTMPVTQPERMVMPEQ